MSSQNVDFKKKRNHIVLRQIIKNKRIGNKNEKTPTGVALFSNKFRRPNYKKKGK